MMKNLLRVGLVFALALTAYGCGGEETNEDADAGVKVDAGKKDAGTGCQTVMCNGECCLDGMVCDPNLNMCSFPSTCTPQCVGKYCGDPDGCGGKCHACPSGQTCDTATWQCKANTCTGSCAGKTCGQDDGCGVKCTGCPSGQTCDQTTWQCKPGSCTGSCAGKTCGADDGCGVQCVGTCPSDQTCNPATFVCEGGSSNCTMASSLGTLTITDDAYFAYEEGTTIGGIEVQTLLNEDAAPDALDISLYSGSGVFSSGIAPGTYPLTGSELNYATCGICILGFTDLDAEGYATDLYFQTGGSVTISSVSGQLQATLTNVTFETVDIASGTYESTPVGDGCTTSISSATVNSTMIDVTNE